MGLSSGSFASGGRLAEMRARPTYHLPPFDRPRSPPTPLTLLVSRLLARMARAPLPHDSKGPPVKSAVPARALASSLVGLVCACSAAAPPRPQPMAAVAPAPPPKDDGLP